MIENDNKFFSILEKLRPESVLKITGQVARRAAGTENKDLKTGKIEVLIKLVDIIKRQ